MAITEGKAVTVALVNNKGGVGKTTTTVSLAAEFARGGRKVLLVDLDGQGSASRSLGLERKDLHRGLLKPCWKIFR